jgi:hypothetical protein
MLTAYACRIFGIIENARWWINSSTSMVRTTNLERVARRRLHILSQGAHPLRLTKINSRGSRASRPPQRLTGGFDAGLWQMAGDRDFAPSSCHQCQEWSGSWPCERADRLPVSERLTNAMPSGGCWKSAASQTP